MMGHCCSCSIDLLNGAAAPCAPAAAEARAAAAAGLVQWGAAGSATASRCSLLSCFPVQAASLPMLSHPNSRRSSTLAASAHRGCRQQRWRRCVLGRSVEAAVVSPLNKLLSPCSGAECHVQRVTTHQVPLLHCCRPLARWWTGASSQLLAIAQQLLNALFHPFPPPTCSSPSLLETGLP
jgi:hypothetical protein